MAWAMVDDKFFSHPKTRRAGKDAVLLYLAALAHSNAYLTDGFISSDELEIIGTQAFQKKPKQLADILVEIELWDEIDGGWMIHDYFEYNKSKDFILAEREKKIAAGSLGGKAKAEANAKARAIANAKAGAKKLPKQNDSDSLAISSTPSTSTISTTTLPPLPPNEIVQFGNVYNDITGNDPQFTPEEVDAVEKIIKAGGTPDDYRNALLAMQEKDYTIGSMKSALNWTLKDLKARTNPKRRNNGGHKSLSPELDEILKDAPIFAEDYPK